MLEKLIFAKNARGRVEVFNMQYIGADANHPCHGCHGVKEVIAVSLGREAALSINRYAGGYTGIRLCEDCARKIGRALVEMTKK
jgi:hypothetical protein